MTTWAMASSMSWCRGKSYIVMAYMCRGLGKSYIVMAYMCRGLGKSYVVMAYMCRGLGNSVVGPIGFRSVLYSYDLYSYGLYVMAPHSYGLSRGGVSIYPNNPSPQFAGVVLSAGGYYRSDPQQYAHIAHSCGFFKQAERFTSSAAFFFSATPFDLM